MVRKVNTARVSIWDQSVGAVTWLEDKGYAVFEYEPFFIHKGWNLSPIHMPLNDSKSKRIYYFPFLNKNTFLGLPGLLADSLPDKFGNAIIDTWLLRNDRTPQSFSPVERLCYSGKRGMGALEFYPATPKFKEEPVPIEIDKLVQLSQQIMLHHNQFDTQLGQCEIQNKKALQDILRVGTSAGGARPKAIIAINDEGKILSGQSIAPNGYEYWILKFDGVNDLELGNSNYFGRIEYAYYLMAKDCGIDMSESRLLEEHNRAHFMTKRFDRLAGERVHMQSLCGIAHYDFNMPGGYGYESAFQIMRKLKLPKTDALELYKRMIFNVLARNQDDHTKNISFLMDKDGRWKLSPFYDVTYSHNPKGQWTSLHQMTINGKRDDFTMTDLIKVGESISLPKPLDIVKNISEIIHNWPYYAAIAGIPKELTTEIYRNHRRIL